MSSYPEDFRFSKSHEWVKIDGEIGIVGLSDHAQKELGEIVYVELPEVGAVFDSGDEFGTVESTKAASELYMPVAGEIIEVNPHLADEPSLVNEDPHGDGWFVKIKVASGTDVGELMNAAKYETYLAEEAKH